MGLKTNKLLIVDLEATCWEDKEYQYINSEIIEIGLAVLDTKSLKVERSRGILVKPKHSEISQYCTNLTTITPRMIQKQGVPLEDAIRIMQKNYPCKRIWASWGNYDRIQIEVECAKKEIEYPFGTSHINLKDIYAIMNQLPKGIGVRKALSQSGLDLEGIHHRGVDDARNIARIAAKMIEKFNNNGG